LIKILFKIDILKYNRMESIINDPSFRELLAKHIAQQMIEKKMIPLSVAAPAPAAAPAAPAAAAPVEAPAPAAPVAAAPVDAPAPAPAPVDPSNAESLPLEPILSGKKRSVTTFQESGMSFGARELIKQAIGISEPNPYNLYMQLDTFRRTIIPYISNYTAENIKLLNIDTLLTYIMPSSYDIFMEKRPILNNLGIKLNPFGIIYYKHPMARPPSGKCPKMEPHISEFVNYVWEYIVCTFLQIILDAENCRYYNYNVKINPNWRKDVNFCQIYAKSNDDLDRVMKVIFDNTFTRL
jgi:hypothetical protein